MTPTRVLDHPAILVPNRASGYHLDAGALHVAPPTQTSAASSVPLSSSRRRRICCSGNRTLPTRTWTTDRSSPRCERRPFKPVSYACCLDNTHPMCAAGFPHGLLASGDNCLYTENVRFEWDLPKARANLHAHGVSFAEAATVLEDGLALTRNDPDAVDGRRFVSLGLSDLGKLLVVVYTYREPDTIRLISAWKANKRQRMQYEKGRC